MGKIKMNNGAFEINDDNYVCIPITFNYTRISGLAKPDVAVLGTYIGFVLPIFASDDQELFGNDCVLEEWDSTRAIEFCVDGWLDTANDNKKFKLQAALGIARDGLVLSSTPTATIEVETDVGASVAQNTFFEVPFTFDAVSAGVQNGDSVGLRLRRIAASANEITGNFVCRFIRMKVPIIRAGSPT